ncbi:GtrA family protein [Allonocardiopsis opalescens]|uniref:Putative flippase GtrA n=1 Tax=Allonocardiopsis opalescens TaxID=1144618 RepID=A0A2T0QC68_9ACTN|nr:GtrA family protein [Allonocardiopsis opalescens]PRY01443.1 putative flippase GtrA [Allonocardiopsis opalescens]
MRPLLSLYRRFAHLIHELGKFGVVGGIAFVVQTLLVNALVLSGTGPYASQTIAIVVATCVTFVGHRFWTFRHRERSGLAREYALFFVFNVVGYLITMACLWLSSDVAGLTSVVASNIANIAGTALGTLFRYWSYKRFVFLAPAAGRGETAGARTGPRQGAAAGPEADAEAEAA